MGNRLGIFVVVYRLVKCAARLCVVMALFANVVKT